MKFMANVRLFLHPVRFLFTALICTMLVLSNAVPAQAAMTQNSKPTDGTTQLNKITEKAEDLANSSPLSMEDVEKRTNGGINEVQGAADKIKMKKSNDSQPAIVKEVEQAADKAIKK